MMRSTGSSPWLVCLSELAGVTAYTGGIGRRYAATLEHLAEQGFEFTVLLTPDTPLAECAGPFLGARLVVIDRFRRLPWAVRPVARAWAVRRFVRAHGFKYVYSPEWLGATALVPRDVTVVTNLVTGLALARASGAADHGARGRWQRCRDLPQSLLERHQILRSERLIACSTAVRRAYEALLARPLPNVNVVPNCIDVGAVAARAKTAVLPEAWPDSRPVVLFAGRLERRKGFDVALDAFSQIAASRSDVLFVFAGAFPEQSGEPTLSSMVSSMPATTRERLVFLGDIDANGLYAAMGRAAMVVCPSRWEAFGNIALEVKACGSALIATTGSGFDDFCQDGIDSLLVRPNDSVALRDAIERLLDDVGLASELARNGSRSVWRNDAATVAVAVQAELTAARGSAT